MDSRLHGNDGFLCRKDARDRITFLETGLRRNDIITGRYDTIIGQYDIRGICENLRNLWLIDTVGMTQ